MSGRIYCFASFGSVQKRTTPSSSSSPPPPSLHAPHSRAHKHVSPVYFETEWKKKKKKERGKEGTDLYLHYLTSRSFFHLFSSLLFSSSSFARSREGKKIYPLPPSLLRPLRPLPPSPSAGDSPAGRIDERRSLHRPVEPSVSMCTLKSLPTYLRST